MGQAPPSKLLLTQQAPTKPFDAANKTPWRRQRLLFLPTITNTTDHASSLLVQQPPTTTTTTTLQQLILRQDWQRVLVRAQLFPKELCQPFVMHLYDATLQMTPLHLACALDPPVCVVQLFLHHCAIASTMPLQSMHPPPSRDRNLASSSSNKKKKKNVSFRQRRWHGRGGSKYQQQQQQQQHQRRNEKSSKEKGLHDSSTNDHRRRRRRRLQLQPPVRRRWQEWRRQRRGAFPVVMEDWQSCVSNMSLEQRQLLLLPRDHDVVHRRRRQHNMEEEEEEDEDAPSVHYTPPPTNNDDSTTPVEPKKEDDNQEHWDQGGSGNDDDSICESVGSSLSSKGSALDDSEKCTTKDVILQLTATGGLTPLVINTSNETESTAETSRAAASDALFRVQWDMQPLLRQVQKSGTLLPLHVACLYGASSAVLEALVRSYPLCALADVLGMMPIHLISAGWSLPRLQPPPMSLIPVEAKPGPLKSLQVLRHAVPESVDVCSGNHGMTPHDYIEECMEDGEYKEACLLALAEADVQDLEAGSALSPDTLIFADSSETSSMQPIQCKSFIGGLSGMILEGNWAGALAAIDDDPAVASKWHYGVDEPSHEGDAPLVWKRLPIHLACAHNAPMGLVQVLLKAFPDGATVEDPHDGSLPLHIACRSGATLAMIKLLLEFAPEATTVIDAQGRLALHVAVMCSCPYPVLEWVVQVDPEAAASADIHGKTPLEYAMEMENDAVTDLLTVVLLLLEKKTS